MFCALSHTAVSGCRQEFRIRQNSRARLRWARFFRGRDGRSRRQQRGGHIRYEPLALIAFNVLACRAISEHRFGACSRGYKCNMRRHTTCLRREKCRLSFRNSSKLKPQFVFGDIGCYFFEFWYGRNRAGARHHDCRDYIGKLACTLYIAAAYVFYRKRRSNASDTADGSTAWVSCGAMILKYVPSYIKIPRAPPIFTTIYWADIRCESARQARMHLSWSEALLAVKIAIEFSSATKTSSSSSCSSGKSRSAAPGVYGVKSAARLLICKRNRRDNRRGGMSSWVNNPSGYEVNASSTWSGVRLRLAPGYTTLRADVPLSSKMAISGLGLSVDSCSAHPSLGFREKLQARAVRIAADTCAEYALGAKLLQRDGRIYPLCRRAGIHIVCRLSTVRTTAGGRL